MTSPNLGLLERRAQAGDPSAFGQLIRVWDKDLRGVAWSVVRSGPATDDVMQDAYERAFRSIKTFDGGASMKTWLHSIVYRTAIDHYRYEGRRIHDDVDDLRSAPATAARQDPERSALDKTELAEVLEQVPPDQRAMLMLTTGLGYSFDETAEILHVNRGTVASRVSRLKQRLSRWEEER